MGKTKLGALRHALLFFAAIHVLALGTMLLVLRPGVDSQAFSLAERAAFVASHVSAWRWGWLPWQLSALSDLGVCLAFLRLAEPAQSMSFRRHARLGLGLFVLSAAPEQWAEAQLVTSFPAQASGDLEAWNRAWSLYAALTGVWANWGYTLMTGCWMLGAKALLGRHVLPERLERALLAAFVVSGFLTLMATVGASGSAAGVWFAASSAVNGLAFPALVVWSLVLWRRLGVAR